MLNDRSSALSLLETRRSSRPRDLVEPGPSRSELDRILRIATRVPDHGKLAPWRFVHVPRDKRPAFHALLERAYRAQDAEPNRAELEALEKFAHQAPTLIVALSTPDRTSKIPVWEQEISCGAAVMNLINATHALGFAAGFVTGWANYSPTILRAFGSPEDRIAGFIFIGTAGVEPEERPRPDLAIVAPDWAGGDLS